MDINVNFIPNGNAMRAFLSALQKQLNALGFDTSDFEVDLLAQQFEFAADAAGKAGNEIAAMGEKLDDVNSQAKEGSSFVEKAFKFEAIGQAGEKLGELSEKFAENNEAVKLLGVRSGAAGAELDALQEGAQRLFANNSGFESMAQATNAMATGFAQLKGTLPTNEIEAFVNKAASIGKTWDVDVNEVVSKGVPFIKNFGLNGEEAGNLLAFAMQKSGNAMGDVLDTLQEYPQLISETGATAEELVGRMAVGVEAGARDTDKLADAWKEAQIRIKEGIAVTDLSGIQAPIAGTIRSIVEAGHAGTKSVNDVLTESAKAIEDAFNAGEISSTMRSQLQIAVAGTPAEDLGAELYGKIFSADIDTEAIKAQGAEIGAALDEGTSITNVTDKIGRALEGAFSGVASFVGPAIGPVAQLATAAGTVGPALAAMDFAGKAKEMGQFALSILSKVIPGLVTQTAATGGATGATFALNAAMLLNPAFLLVAGIGALVAAFVIFSKSTKSADDAVKDLNESTEKYKEASAKATEVKKQSDDLRKLADSYDNLKDKTDPESQKEFAKVTAELRKKVPELANDSEKAGNKVAGLGKQFSFSTKEIRSFADEQESLANDLKDNAFQNQAEQVQAAFETYDDLKEKISETREERDRYLKDVEQGRGAQATGYFDFESAKTNLSDARKELGKLTKDQDTAVKGIQDYIKAQVELGLNAEQIAEQSGEDIKTIQAFGQEIFEAQTKAVAVGGEMKKVGEQTRSAADKAKELGVAFDNALKASADLSAGSISALAQGLFNLESAKKQLQVAQSQGNLIMTLAAQSAVTLLDANVKQLEASARAAVSSEKNMQRFLDEAERRAGKSTPKPADKPEAIVKNEIDALEIINNMLKDLGEEIDLASKTDELDKSLTELAQNQAKALEDLKKQYDDLIRQRDDAAKKGSTTTFINEGALQELQQNGKVYNATLKKFELEKQEILREAAREQLENERSAAEERQDREIEFLQQRADRIEAFDEKTFLKRQELLLKANILSRDKEERAIVENNELYLQAIGERALAENKLREAKTQAEQDAANNEIKLANDKALAQRALILQTAREMQEINELEFKNLDEISDEERSANTKRIEELKATHSTLAEEVTASADELQAVLTTHADSEKDIYTELSDWRYQKLVQDLRDQNALREKETQRHIEEMKRLFSTIISITETRGEEFIGAKEQAALAQLDELRARDVISEQEHERRKTEIAKDAAAERAGLAARARGIQLETDRQADLENLRAQEKSKEELLKTITDPTEREEINKELTQIRTDIKDKGNLLTGVTGELQDAMSELFTGLVNAEEDDIKAPFKKAFGVLIGALQRLASAKIAEVLLGSISGVLGLPGLAASLLAKNLITSLINSILNPIFSKINSFAEGSGPLTTPQLAIVGDAPVPERVLRDDQLEAILSLASIRGAEMMLPYLSELINLFREYPNKIKLVRSDVTNVVNEENSRRRRGVVG